jgi:hypothetical protein
MDADANACTPSRMNVKRAPELAWQVCAGRWT